MFERVVTGFAFAPAIAVFSWRTRFLTGGGSIAQFVLGWILLAAGGWAFVVPLLVFFLSSSFLSRLFRTKRVSAEEHFQKGARRDAGQVIANGGIATLLVLVWWYSHERWAVTGFLGAVAAANADTWATEIGTLARNRPLLITSLRRVDTGTSGGISGLGLAAAAAGAAVVAASGMFLEVTDIAIPAALGGFAGCVADSLLGATIQAQYRCPVCGMRTERRVHCATAGTLDRGWKWVQNDQVNALCTLVAAGNSWFLASSGVL